MLQSYNDYIASQLDSDDCCVKNISIVIIFASHSSSRGVVVVVGFRDLWKPGKLT